MRLTIITLAVMATLAFPTPAAADPVAVDEHGCPAGTTWTQTAGVPLCLAPIWLDGTWNDDPRECVYGFYQGTCAPEPRPPVVQPEVNYEFQMDPAVAAAHTPAIIAAAVHSVVVGAKREVWLDRLNQFMLSPRIGS